MSKGFPDGLCQEAYPASDWPYEQDWIVDRVTMAKDGFNSWYPIWVVGTNRNDNSRFIWNLPLPLSWRYDLTNAEYGPGVLDVDAVPAGEAVSV